MHKNDRFTFNRYSEPHWRVPLGRARAYTYVPDEIFEPVLSTLQKHARDILKFGDVLMIETLKARPGRAWTWPETLAAMQAVWQDMDPRFGAFAQDMLDNAAFRRNDVHTGHGKGRCFYDFAEIDCEGNVNDPVCAVHESGHLMALMHGPDQYDTDPAPNIREIQAMFAQEHAYDWLQHHAQSDDEALSIKRHRMTYYTGILMNVPLYLYMLGRPDAPRASLSETFTKWAVDFRMAERLSYDQDGNRKGPQHLHTHPFAAMLAPALFERFQGKDSAQKQAILSVLYEGGAETTLTDILSAFDIETPEDVRIAAEQTCLNFKQQISSCLKSSHATRAIVFAAP